MQPRLPAYNATTSFPPAPVAQLFGAAPFVRSLPCSQPPGAGILFDLDSCFHVDGLHFAGQNSASLMEKVLRLRRISCVGGLVPTAWHLQRSCRRLRRYTDRNDPLIAPRLPSRPSPGRSGYVQSPSARGGTITSSRQLPDPAATGLQQSLDCVQILEIKQHLD